MPFIIARERGMVIGHWASLPSAGKSVAGANPSRASPTTENRELGRLPRTGVGLV